MAVIVGIIVVDADGDTVGYAIALPAFGFDLDDFPMVGDMVGMYVVGSGVMVGLIVGDAVVGIAVIVGEFVGSYVPVVGYMVGLTVALLALVIDLDDFPIVGDIVGM